MTNCPANYTDFIATKMAAKQGTGIEVSTEDLSQILFPFQRKIVRWALATGRAALFEDCGLGKTFQQLEWARQVHAHTGKSVLIYAPLTIAQQTKSEAVKLGVEVRHVSFGSQIMEPGIYVTNYERHHLFEGLDLGGIVLDESSILKNATGKIRTALIEQAQSVPFRLCCTATPAPNDITEIASHSEFLGVKTRQEMLAHWFVHDQDGWRLKGHATREFYKWLATWSVFLRDPSDIGESAEGYNLPALDVRQVSVDTEAVPDGFLFQTDNLKGVSDRAAVRKSTITDRVNKAVEIIRESWENKPSPDKSATLKNAQPTSAIGIKRTEKTSLPRCESGETQRIHALESSVGKNTIKETPSPLSLKHANTTGATPTSKHPIDCPNTISPQISYKTSMKDSLVPVQSVDEKCPTGEASKDCISTIATQVDMSEDCYAQTAIAESGCFMTVQNDCGQQRPTCKIQWIVWCGLNSEQDAVVKALGDDCVSVSGSDSDDQKLERLSRFIRGEVAVLVTKCRICGFGLNLQNCSRQIFVGIGDSWEQYYQCLRRSYRFGQAETVLAWIVTTNLETSIVENVMAKEQEARILGDSIIENIGDLERKALSGHGEASVPPGYIKTVKGSDWTLHNGDCVDVMAKMPNECVDLSVYSPPFATLYTYSDNPRDMGNCVNYDQFYKQFRYAIEEIFRITKPGRLTCVHLAQTATTVAGDGYTGLNDFRGAVIDAYKRAGFVHYREVTIDKCPQAQAIRTHSKALLFVQMKKDRSWSGPALADFVVIFRKPGEPTVPIRGGVTNDEWIEWARPVWYGIRESDTLNAAEARSDKDERHICPLQLGVIKRCVKLWSNPGELVFSPFSGIGSEGYQSLIEDRRFEGAELKPEYFNVALRNLRKAELSRGQQDLFFGLEEAIPS